MILHPFKQKKCVGQLITMPINTKKVCTKVCVDHEWTVGYMFLVEFGFFWKQILHQAENLVGCFQKKIIF